MSLTFIDLHGNMHYENEVNQTRNNFFWKEISTKQMNRSKKKWNKNLKNKKNLNMEQ
jgi:hypothetical protein